MRKDSHVPDQTDYPCADRFPVNRALPDRVFPDPATRATYDALFREFPGLHARNRRMFARLNR
jgi:hypothetical protein